MVKKDLENKIHKANGDCDGMHGVGTSKEPFTVKEKRSDSFRQIFLKNFETHVYTV